MTGEKQEIQEEETTISEEKQPESTEKPQPTIEEYEALQQELEKAKNQVNTFQGLLKDTQRKSITKDDLTSIYDRIDGQQRWIATKLDDIRKVQGGDYEEPQTHRKSYSEDVEDNINKAKENRQPPKDPAADKFFEYLAEEGLEWESEFVEEAIKDSKNAQEALKNIKAKVKERNETKVRADFKKEMEGEKDRIREEILKELGYTASGPNQPSASRLDLSSMTPDEKLQKGFEKLTKKK